MSRIKEWRTKRAITQTEFGRMLGVSCETVNRWENQKCCPTFKNLKKIAGITGIAAVHLMEEFSYV